MSEKCKCKCNGRCAEKNAEPETMILLERQAKRIKELEDAIRGICKSCWAHSKQAPECNICSISKLKVEVPE